MKMSAELNTDKSNIDYYNNKITINRTTKREIEMTENLTENKEKLILDGHKLVNHMDRVKAWAAGERIAPITIDLALTRACNFKCVYCYGMLQENKREDLNKDVLFRFIDDVSEIGVKGLSLISDGESTCSPHFYDFISYAKKKGLDIGVGTNGYLLKEEKLKEMLSNLTYLRFNISAGEADRYAYIHGVTKDHFYKVCDLVRKCMKIKKENNLSVTVGLQMVLMPDFKDQIIPLTKLGKELGADYLVIKHCSDDENNSIGVDYSGYYDLVELLKEAESYSTPEYFVKAKWSKIMSGGKRKYSRCYGPPFILQISGSGLVAPCGMLFNDKYKKFHIGNIAKESFKDMWKGERYWEVMNYIASDKFNAHTDCGSLCLQHKVNEFLWDIKEGEVDIKDIQVPLKKPDHVNFI